MREIDIGMTFILVGTFLFIMECGGRSWWSKSC